jgi:hypothetical protein
MKSINERRDDSKASVADELYNPPREAMSEPTTTTTTTTTTTATALGKGAIAATKEKRKAQKASNRRRYQTVTPRKRRPPAARADDGSFVCPFCQTSGFPSHQSLVPHKRICDQNPLVAVEMDEGGQALLAGNNRSSLSLTPPHLADRAGCLSDFGQLVVQSLELYQVQASDLPRLPKNGRTIVREGNIGIRCVYCASSQGSLSIGSTLFPGSRKLVSIGLYRMTDLHLISQQCPHVAATVRAQLQATKVDSTRQSMSKGRIGLPTYLQEVMDYYNLVDDPTAKGVRRRELPSAAVGRQHEGQDQLLHIDFETAV